jgi:hypothetical protein
LSVGGHAIVYGTLSTPQGVGSCCNGAVNALTETGQADVVDGLVQLPQALTFPPARQLDASNYEHELVGRHVRPSGWRHRLHRIVRQPYVEPGGRHGVR